MTNSDHLMTQLEKHQLDSVLSAIYGEEPDVLAASRTRLHDAIAKYIDLFGDGDIEIYSAPGRTELCGNHTDHQHGRILAASIHLDAIAIVGTTSDQTIDFVSEGYPPVHIEKALFSEADISEAEYGTTAALIKGVLCGLRTRGYRTDGFRAYVTSDVPGGSGLSSSAALETLIGTILSGLYNDMKISSVELALVGQYAENAFFGKPCGLEDQLACSVGGIIHVDFRDSARPDVRKIPAQPEAFGYSLCIVDTGGSHASLTEDYTAIPREMRQVAEAFGKEYLREITPEQFFAALPALYGKVADRALLRAYHFLTEDERAEAAATALGGNCFPDFLALIRASGDSSYRFLQNVYSDKIKQQPLPVALMLSEHYLAGRGACRVHGGGFAGTIQAFVPADAVHGYRQWMESVLGKGCCHVLRIRKQGGIKIV